MKSAAWPHDWLPPCLTVNPAGSPKIQSAAQGRELLTGKYPKRGDATVAMDADDPRWNNCAECGERFAEDETPVPSRSIVGAPLVHEECA